LVAASQDRAYNGVRALSGPVNIIDNDSRTVIYLPITLSLAAPEPPLAPAAAQRTER
jgi:hypothetical protein